MNPPTREVSADPVSRERIATDLEQLGLAKGDHVAVGVSLKSIGNVVGGPYTLIDAILDVVGPHGTIMVPTFTVTSRGSSPRRAARIESYDPRTTRCNTGIVAETLRKRSDAMRSCHPSNSIAAIGAEASVLTGFHDASASAYAPYSKLADLDGRFLGIGIGNRFVGLRHEAQARAGLLDVVPLRTTVRYRDSNGETRIFVRGDVGGCTIRLEDLAQRLRQLGAVRDGNVGNAQASLVSAKLALQQMTDWLRENPALNLCQSVRCLWCRELERRLDLYGQLEHPHWFQRSHLARFAIRQVNRLRLWRTR